MKITLPALLGACLLAAPVMAQRAAPGPASVARGVTASAIVENVDLTERQVLLRGTNGDLRTIRVGPEVRNLAQMRVGDTVTLAFGEALVLAVADARDGQAPLAALATGARAQAGARPGAGATQLVQARVRVDAVDRATGSVTFTGPLGVQRTARPRNPQLLTFVRALRPGQMVDVAYAEAVELRVAPSPRR